MPAGPSQTPLAQELAPAAPLPHDPVPTKVERAAAPKPEEPQPEITVISPPQPDTDDPEKNQDTVLQLASSDPDITIYWLVGRNGD